MTLSLCRRLTVVALIATIPTTLISGFQPPPTIGTACKGTPARALDFWLGRWDVFNRFGQHVAESRVELVADGCGVLESYVGDAGPAGNRYIGTGIHVYDAGPNAWRQLFSDNSPSATLMLGHPQGPDFVYEWEIVNPQGQRIPKRYTLQELPEGRPHDPRVRQLGERSNDDGRTWIVEFDLRYVRSNQSPQ